MKILNRLLFIICSYPLFVTAQQPVSIIPQPVSIQQQPGNFILTGNTAILYNPQQKDLKNVVDFFNQQIKILQVLFCR